MNDAILRELKEDIEREKLRGLWEKYGGYVVGIALVVLLGVGSQAAWRHYTAGRNLETGSAFAGALELAATNKHTEAAAAFEKLAADAPSGYAALARLRAADALLKAEKPEEAQKLYTALVTDGSADTFIRSMARLALASRQQVAEAEKTLTPIAQQMPLYPYARELLASKYLEAGETTKAQEVLEKLAADVSTPSTLRARAQEALAALGVATQADGSDASREE